MRLFAALFQRKPTVGTIFKHRDIDLYLKVTRFTGKGKPVVAYGYLLKDGRFQQLPNRAFREKSVYSLHYDYDEV